MFLQRTAPTSLINGLDSELPKDRVCVLREFHILTPGYWPTVVETLAMVQSCPLLGTNKKDERYIPGRELGL